MAENINYVSCKTYPCYVVANIQRATYALLEVRINRAQFAGTKLGLTSCLEDARCV